MNQVKLWQLVKSQNGVPVAKEVTSTPQMEAEKMLEDVLVASPELLLEELRVIGRQCETETGPLDILGLDEEGRLVVFELKRGTLRREAVAQAVDYASYLGELSAESLSKFIEDNWRNLEGSQIDDFADYYSQKFHPKRVEDIGIPKIILVGIGADSATVRMVNFLIQGGLDISILTFHAFVEDGKTFLAKQVETRTLPVDSAVNKATKASNQALLLTTLDKMAITSEFETVARSIRQSLGPNCYQWPSGKGYAFSRVEIDLDGQRKRPTVITLLVDPAHPKQFQISLQPRFVEHAGILFVKKIAESMGSLATPTPAGYVSFWVNAQQPDLADKCKRLTLAISSKAADEVQLST